MPGKALHRHDGDGDGEGDDGDGDGEGDADDDGDGDDDDGDGGDHFVYGHYYEQYDMNCIFYVSLQIVCTFFSPKLKCEEGFSERKTPIQCFI